MKLLGLESLCRTAERGLRFGGFDPFLNASRLAGVARWGPGLSALVHASALRWPARTAVIDDYGSLSYSELDRRADALANFLRADGAGPVGLLCRNHRGFPLSLLALDRSGRDVVLLSTALPGTQLRDIVEREGLSLLIADDEFADRLAEAELNTPIVPANPAGLASWSRPGGGLPPWKGSHRSDIILLTSGTTGPPKGARRAATTPSLSTIGLLDALPLGMNDVTLVASPLFHAWGLAQSTIALSTGSTLIVHDHFDPDTTLRCVEDHKVSVLAVVPLILSRMLDAAPAELELPHLRAVLCSGNVLSATLAQRWIARFGQNLYNVYGSTETAIASVATPRHLIDAPGTVGRAPRGVTVVVLTDDNLPAQTGELGRVFTGNSMQFDGYTDGSNRTRLGSLMATGDLGYLDSRDMLFVDGRENDLIVTGGENVFPSQIEEILDQHPQIQQSAVVGLPDDDYGQRVAAFIVASDATLDLAEVRAWAKTKFAPFQLPREYRIVDALPMTTTGKVIRHALATLGLAEHL